ncbi:MAG: enoyl-CoA hydratase/isomerase family protein [Alicyclobacillus shizuokensis]|nr:enoyl-CoA hydratase/isomerase family protein [Alicyclobacillus shizuokensis]
MAKHLQLRIEDGVAWVEVDNPPVNAFSLAAFAQLDDVLTQIQQDDAVRVVVLTAKGDKAFVAGIDIKEVAAYGRAEMAAFNRVSRAALGKLETLPKPVIAAVSGAAYGAGFELALACDFRIAAAHAVFALPELTLGIIPGGGGTQRLTRLVGEARAKEVILLGRPLTADEAKDWGLVCEVYEAQNLLDGARDFARKLSERPAVALGEAKRVIHAAFDNPLSHGLDLENEAFLKVFASQDAHEGITAFREKRRPAFIGR